MRSLLLALLVSSPALAEAQKPKFAVHPLVLEGVDSKKDREDLSALLPGIIIAVGKVEIASPSDVDAELKKKGQAFCSPENLFKCLSYIADHTSSVHAIRIEVRRGGRPNEWQIVANVVCVDGSVERQPDVFTFTQSEAVKFLPIARAKLEEFVATLKLSELPVAPPAKAVAVADPVKPKTDAPKAAPLKTDVPAIVNPQPHGTSKLRMASYIMGGTAAAALAIGGVFSIVAKADSGTLTVNNGGIPRSQIPIAQGVDAKVHTGTVFLVLGSIVGATAITLFLVSDSIQDTVITPTPIPGGAGVVFSSRF